MTCTNACLRCFKSAAGLTGPQVRGLVMATFHPGHVFHFVRRGGAVSLCGLVGRDGRRAGYFGARMSKAEMAGALSRAFDWKEARRFRRGIPQDLWEKFGPGRAS